jgi:predicted O-linked N-acetylglucosamine transferase (SPINDLY family)
MTPLAHLLAAAQRRLSSHDEAGARVLYEEILVLQPHHPGALRELTKILMAREPAIAVIYAQRLAERHGKDAEALSLLGQALSGAGRAFEAVGPFRAAAVLTPNAATAHTNLALSLLRAGDPAGAREAAARAVALDDTLIEGHANLGHALVALRLPDAAMDSYRVVLARSFEHPDALHGVAMAQRLLGNSTAAATALMRATTAAPNWIAAHVELGSVLSELGDFDGALAACRRATALSPESALYASNYLFALQYHPEVSAETATAEARDWGTRICARLPVLPTRTRGGTSPARLRIGYVSADLYRHPVGWLGAAAIRAHNRSDVHVTVYANQVIRDDVTDSVGSNVDKWFDVFGMDDDALAARIHDDKIDVLVDLSGHTGGNRMSVFARRAAPVQVSWLGYFATTGLPTMDAILLDDDHVSQDGEAFFSERVVRLATGRFCYTAPSYAPAPRFPATDTVTFASFNNAAKLNKTVITLWARVLMEVPDSRLLLKSRAFADGVLQERIVAHFAQTGVTADRLTFEGHVEHAAMLDQYGDVDVALDPFPFCGGLTTCEALWMGVPVVTLPGRAVVSRQSHAILRSIGAGAWSAKNEDDYVSIAVRLAHDVSERRTLRHSLRERMRASPLCDGPRLARELESAYRALWEAWNADTPTSV